MTNYFTRVACNIVTFDKIEKQQKYISAYGGRSVIQNI